MLFKLLYSKFEKICQFLIKKGNDVLKTYWESNWKEYPMTPILKIFSRKTANNFSVYIYTQIESGYFP